MQPIFLFQLTFKSIWVDGINYTVENIGKHRIFGYSGCPSWLLWEGRAETNLFILVVFINAFVKSSLFSCFGYTDKSWSNFFFSSADFSAEKRMINSKNSAAINHKKTLHNTEKLVLRKW